MKLIPACAEDKDLISRLEADAGTNVNLAINVASVRQDARLPLQWIIHPGR